MTIARGENLLAADMLNLAFFPKGMILMYDGTGWQDNVTLKGWYQCKGGTVNGLNIPDLRDKFIMGYNGGTRTGGKNAQTLAMANLPSHDHALSTVTTSSDGTHTHDAHTGSFRNLTWLGKRDVSGVFSGSTGFGGDFSAKGDSAEWTVSMNASHNSTGAHTHTVSGSTDSSGSSTAFDNRPSYYALIYIIKVTEAGKDSF